MSRKLCTVLFLQLVIMVSTSLSTQCYDCTSLLNPNCADPFNSTGMTRQTCAKRQETTDENALGSVCFKEKAKVDGEWQYLRGCARDGQDGYFADNCIQRNSTFDLYCLCKGDMCNTAESARASTLLIAMYLFLAYVLLV